MEYIILFSDEIANKRDAMLLAIIKIIAIQRFIQKCLLTVVRLQIITSL
jgi:hypothetical protein